jgi:2-polyprenyl-3-methyl-5-hydroxy-6-metoxy-1,4-benzoquinol methylase
MTRRFSILSLPSLEEFSRKVYRRLVRYELWLEYQLRRPQPDKQLQEDAQQFWNQGGELLNQYAHWRGAGVFSDEERWRALGRQHLERYLEFARMVGRTAPLRRIVEWGTGGGAMAVQFAPLAQEYVGVDITAESLAECSRQLSQAGYTHFVPTLISALHPEEALAKVPGPCDLFLCIHVFEILPTPEYGLRLLSIARDLLAPGGMAMIQIRYIGQSWDSRPKRFGYNRFLASMTSYRIEEFWAEAERCGLKPRAVSLMPWQPLIENGNYAYFFLTKE